MNEHLGRANKIKLDGTTAICFTSLSEEYSAELIDISSSCSSGKTVYLEEAGSVTMTLSIEGMIKDRDMQAKMRSGFIMFNNAVLEYADGSTQTMDLALSSISFASPFKEAATFSASLSGSGDFNFVAASS